MKDRERWVPLEKYENLEKSYARLLTEFKELKKFEGKRNRYERRIEDLERKVASYRKVASDTIEVLKEVVSEFRGSK